MPSEPALRFGNNGYAEKGCVSATNVKSARSVVIAVLGGGVGDGAGAGDGAAAGSDGADGRVEGVPQAAVRAAAPTSASSNRRIADGSNAIMAVGCRDGRGGFWLLAASRRQNRLGELLRHIRRQFRRLVVERASAERGSLRRGINSRWRDAGRLV